MALLSGLNKLEVFVKLQYRTESITTKILPGEKPENGDATFAHTKNYSCIVDAFTHI